VLAVAQQGLGSGAVRVETLEEKRGTAPSVLETPQPENRIPKKRGRDLNLTRGQAEGLG